MRVSSSCGRIVAPKVGSLFALVIVLIECGKSLAFLPVVGCFSIRHCSGVHDASVHLVRRIENRTSWRTQHNSSMVLCFETIVFFCLQQSFRQSVGELWSGALEAAGEFSRVIVSFVKVPRGGR